MNEPSEFINTLYKATATIRALQPEPQFAIVHPEDFPAMKEQLEKQGVEVTQLTESSIWNCVMTRSGLVSGVLLKIAVSEEAKRGQAYVMPLPDGKIYPISPYKED